MTRNLFSFFSEDGAGRKRGRDEPKPAVKDQGEDCAPEVVGGADSVQTIQGLIPVGQPSGEGVSTEEEPMMEIPPCKRKRTRDSSCVNPKWSELSEADQKIYLDISPLPDAFKPEALSHLDIALAVDHRLSDSEKMAFLTQCWQPSKSYNFYPVLQGSNRFPQLKWHLTPILFLVIVSTASTASSAFSSARRKWDKEGIKRGGISASDLSGSSSISPRCGRDIAATTTTRTQQSPRRTLRGR